MAIFDNWKVALLSGFAIGFFCGFLQYELSAQVCISNLNRQPVFRQQQIFRIQLWGMLMKELEMLLSGKSFLPNQ